MYTRIAVLAALLAATPLAHADESVAQLAQETGLSERNVRMVVGGRTAYAEYRVIFNRVDRQFKEAVGEVRYEQITGRKPLPALSDNPRETRVAARREETKDKVAGL